jgi:glycosyltransferase involved in cell wall biosynthesis
LSVRVAINAVSLSPGGGASVLFGILSAWRKLELPVEVLVYASRAPIIEGVRDAMPAAEVIPFALAQPPWKHFLLQQTRLGPRIDDEGAQVVWTTQTLVGRCRTPQLVHHQNILRFVHRQRSNMIEYVRDVFSRRALSQAATNVYISRYMRELVERQNPATCGRNEVVYNGVDGGLSKRDLIPADYRPGHLIAVQSPSYYKDTDALLRMLGFLVYERPGVPWRLRIAGGGDFSSTARLAATLGMSDRVEFLGHVPLSKLVMMMAESEALVYPSRVEGFGLPPLEAMSAGCPVVACDATAIPEIVQQAGILVPPGDSRSYARAILQIHDDAPLRHRLIESGLQRVRQFGWEQSAEKMYLLLRRIGEVDFQ